MFKIKINPRIKKLWLYELRNGKKKQGKKRLRYKDTFCCLGILCNIYQREKKKNLWIDELNNGYFSFSDEESVLPQKVADWAEIKIVKSDSRRDFSNRNPTILIRADVLGIERPISLGQLNDEGATFHEIADLIEKTYE